MSTDTFDKPRNNRRRGSRHRNNRNSNRGRGNYNRSRSRSRDDRPKEPAKKKNFFLALIEKIFGTGKKPSSRNSQKPSYSSSSNNTSSSSQSSSTRPKREPEILEVTSSKLYVGNLSYDLSESDLFDLFSTVGQVKNVEIVRDRNSNSKGFGFVEMSSLETAKEATEKYHRQDLMGRQLVVSGAKN